MLRDMTEDIERESFQIAAERPGTLVEWANWWGRLAENWHKRVTLLHQDGQGMLSHARRMEERCRLQIRAEQIALSIE